MTAALPVSTHAPHRVHANIYPGCVASNISTLRTGLLRQGHTPRFCATVKSDAYGHGLRNVLPGLDGACALAVMQLSDAYDCRMAGWRKTIVVLGGLGDESEVGMLDLPGLHLVITHAAQIDWLAASLIAQPDLFIWLRFRGDIGLTGFDDNAYREAYARCAGLAATRRIAGVGHLHHHASAERDHGIAAADARFKAVVSTLPGPCSTSNSATVLRHAEHAARDDWIRPGLALFGASPLAQRSARELGFKPAMSLHARIIGVRDLVRGESMGYNASFTAAAPTRVGIVSCGYGDGYPRHAPPGTPVQVGTRLTRTLGTVTMDLMTIDLTGLPEANIGHRVTLWGTPELPVETVASAIGTIAADLFTGLTRRVPLIPINAV